MTVDLTGLCRARGNAGCPGERAIDIALTHGVMPAAMKADHRHPLCAGRNRRQSTARADGALYLIAASDYYATFGIRSLERAAITVLAGHRPAPQMRRSTPLRRGAMPGEASAGKHSEEIKKICWIRSRRDFFAVHAEVP